MHWHHRRRPADRLPNLHLGGTIQHHHECQRHHIHHDRRLQRQAEEAVVTFYKQMDQLGQGKLDINKVTTWSRIVMDGTDTKTKWTNSLGDQVYGQKILQVGTTAVSDLSGKEVDKPKSDVKFDAAYSVTACVDRSQLTYEKNGKPVDYNAGVATKSLVTHLVTEYKDAFRVVQDEPGESC